MLLGQNPNVLNMFPGLQRLLPNTSLPSIPTITAQPTYQGKFFIRPHVVAILKVDFESHFCAALCVARAERFFQNSTKVHP